MSLFLSYLLIGITTGAIYSLTASGLVLTYSTTRIFNFAHGAIGMVVAFICYELWVGLNWPGWLAVLGSVLVVAPAIGLALDVTVMRLLQRTGVRERFAGTLALFLGLTGLAFWIWPVTVQRTMPNIFGAGSVSIGSDLTVTDNTLGTVGVAVIVGLGLWALLHRTTLGVAMRAAIDSPELTELNGISSRLLAKIVWPLGCSLAALAAILTTAGEVIDVVGLSDLVIVAFAAAVVGRLTNLPATIGASVVLGMATSLSVGYFLSAGELLQELTSALPFIMLFIAAVVLRDRSRVYGQEFVVREPASPPLRSVLVAFCLAMALVIIASGTLSNANALVAAAGLIYAIILLSQVLVTGLSGQLALCQFSFMGIGVILVTHADRVMPYWLAFIVAIAGTMIVGALVGLATVKASGIYVGVATLAFAVAMDNTVFVNSHLFSYQTGGLAAPTFSMFGWSASSDQRMVMASGVIAGACALGLYFVKRGKYGRLLAALRDSPNAASALGLNVAQSRLVVFAIGAGMAAVAGCLFGSLYVEVSASSFDWTQSVTAALILCIWGLVSVRGAVVGAIFYSVFYLMLGRWITNPNLLQGIQPVGIGLAVLALAQHPEGAVMQIRGAGSRTRERMRLRGQQEEAEAHGSS